MGGGGSGGLPEGSMGSLRNGQGSAWEVGSPGSHTVGWFEARVEAETEALVDMAVWGGGQKSALRSHSTSLLTHPCARP